MIQTNSIIITGYPPDEPETELTLMSNVGQHGDGIVTVVEAGTPAMTGANQTRVVLDLNGLPAAVTSVVSEETMLDVNGSLSFESSWNDGADMGGSEDGKKYS